MVFGMVRNRAALVVLCVGVAACLFAAATAPPNGALKRYETVDVDLVEPEYAKWDAVNVGMTEADVLRILGKPLEQDDVPPHRGDAPFRSRTVAYGRLRFRSPAVPGALRFQIEFQNGEVVAKADPFGGHLSRDGKPTVPVPIFPVEYTILDHHPRFLDTRWYPSSGEYPITYTVQVEYAWFRDRGLNGKPIWLYEPLDELASRLPHVAVQFMGMQPGRWRVRASNRLGESDWTDWSRFEFAQ